MSCYNLRLRVRLKKKSCIIVHTKELDGVPSTKYLSYIC